MVGHDSVVGAFSFVGLNVTIGGRCNIEPGCFFGMGVSVLPDLHIGTGVTVAASACLTKSIAADSVEQVWAGVPAKLQQTGEDSVNARKVMCCLEVDVLGLILVSKIIRFVQLMVDVYA